MATTIKESFRIFKENLEITDRQTAIVSNCRENIVKTFKDSHISLHDNPALLIGSYDRFTLIRPLFSGDVDLMVILHYGDNKDYETPDGTIRMLDRFKYVLDEKYPSTEKRRSRNCITMKLSEFSLDVVPAFRYNEGYYTIPDSIDRKWIQTNPIEFASKMSGINQTMDSCLKPLIKMVKAWNREHGKVLSGYHIECIMHNHYKAYTKSYTYDSMLKVFFGKLPEYLSNYCFDPIMGGVVDSYLGGMSSDIRNIAIKKANAVAELSERAFTESESGHILESVNTWKNIFGDYFPSY